MNITPINNTQNFKGLNFHKVSPADRSNFIKGNLNELWELGKKYDIRLTSCYEGVPNFASIDIDVKPLTKGFNVIKKFFLPTGKSTFKAGAESLNESQNTKIEFMNSVHKAIADLNSQLEKR